MLKLEAIQVRSRRLCVQTVLYGLYTSHATALELSATGVEFKQIAKYLTNLARYEDKEAGYAQGSLASALVERGSSHNPSGRQRRRLDRACQVLYRGPKQTCATGFITDCQCGIVWVIWVGLANALIASSVAAHMPQQNFVESLLHRSQPGSIVRGCVKVILVHRAPGWLARHGDCCGAESARW